MVRLAKQNERETLYNFRIGIKYVRLSRLQVDESICIRGKKKEHMDKERKKVTVFKLSEAVKHTSHATSKLLVFKYVRYNQIFS